MYVYRSPQTTSLFFGRLITEPPKKGYCFGVIRPGLHCELLSPLPWYPGVPALSLHSWDLWIFLMENPRIRLISRFCF